MTLKTPVFIAFSTFILLLNARADITTGLQAQWEFDDGPGSSTTADSSGNGNNGTLLDFSDATFTNMWVTGRFSDALLFNANGDTNDYVSVPDSSSLDSTASAKQMTLAAWVKLSVAGSAQTNSAAIISKGYVGLEQYSLGISNGVFQFVIRNSSGKSGQLVNSTVSPVAGVWYHIAGIWSASPQQQYIYVNGSFNNSYSGTGFLTSGFNTNHPVSIGCKESSVTSGYNLPFQGVIDDARIYNRALSASDIYQLYTNNATSGNAPVILTQPRGVTAYLGDSPAFAVVFDPSVTLLPVGYQWQFNSTNISGATTSTLVITNAQATNAGNYSVIITNFEGSTNSSNALLTLHSLPATNTSSGLVGYWKFDDASGSSNAVDSSGNGHSGMLSGFTDTTFTSMWTNGVFNGALAFNSDGSGSNVVAVTNLASPAPPILDFSGSPVFSLTAWINGPATQTNGAGIISKGTGGGGEQYVLDIFGGDYRFFVRDTNGNAFTAQTAVPPNGQWQHVAAVLNASNGILNCYVNGQLAASSVAPFTVQTNGHEVDFGNRQPGSVAYLDAFTGLMDDVRIYNRDLTSADVSALYAARPSPLVVTWPTASFDIVAGANAQLAPTIQGGVPPYTYQWQLNGTNLPGATAYPLSLTNVAASAAGSYDLIVSNGSVVPAVTSASAVVTIEPYLTFNNTGVTWTTQGTTAAQTWQGTNIAELTAGTLNESNSVFYAYPLYVGAFQVSFNYQNVNPTNSGEANGLTFCIQNDPRGPAALGFASVHLGVGSITSGPGSGAITPSVEFEFNISTANGIPGGNGQIGVSWDTNGAVVGPLIPTAPLAINSGDIINVLLTCTNGLATITLTDTNAGTQFVTTNQMDIPSLLGTNLAYIGFTASDGAASSVQQVSDFTYQSIVGLSMQSAGSSVHISWPTGVGGYALQKNSSLTTTNWVNVTNTVGTVNGQNQAAIPATGGAQFFQLVLPP